MFVCRIHLEFLDVEQCSKCIDADFFNRSRNIYLLKRVATLECVCANLLHFIRNVTFLQIFAHCSKIHRYLFYL